MDNDCLATVLDHPVIESSGLVLALAEIKGFTSNESIIGSHDLKDIVCAAIDDLNAIDSGILFDGVKG
jgi:hypothetical protein